ncbi:MAG: hypothetical protein J6Y69_07710, partial [Treponema sp.]|nr:hypothetical protein [Treponema sp.]
RRWLDTIKTQSRTSKPLQNITYSFDSVGNVLGYKNNCLDSINGNYRTEQTYTYDSLYQLTSATGYTEHNPTSSTVAPEYISRYNQVFTVGATLAFSFQETQKFKKILDDITMNVIQCITEGGSYE